MMRNILITGGAGFIGSSLAIQLQKKGYNITILDNLSPQIHGNNPAETSALYKLTLQNNLRFIKGSVEEKESWMKALKGQHAVIHLAAETGTGQSMYEIKKYTDVNIGGTSLLMDILINSNFKIDKLIVASSRAIYGEGKYNCATDGIVYPSMRNEEDLKSGAYECTCPECNKIVSLLSTDEKSKIHPTSIYGITKQNQEQIVMVLGKSKKIPTVSLRFQNVYGPGQSLINPYTGILSIFSTLILNNQAINIFEDGMESRDFVYIDDVVAATLLCLENDAANYQTYNVGTGESVSVSDVVSKLKKNYKSNPDIEISGNFRLGDIRHNKADISKIRKELGFNPATSFTDGLTKFCKWVLTQGRNDSMYLNSLSEMKRKGLLK